MGIFDKVKKILFDEEEIEDLPVRDDKREEENEMAQSGGVILHHAEDEEEDTIQEVKVPEEKPATLRFPIFEEEEKDERIVNEEDTDLELNEIQKRLDEDNLNRTVELEKVREENLTRSKEDFINEYNESKRLERMEEPRREVIHDKTPYRVPPVISPVFGVLDKTYDPDKYEETREKITMKNSGNTTFNGERQFGPVSYNDQGIPQPKYVKQTVVVTTTSDAFKEELKKDAEMIKEAEKIEKEIIDSIINNDNYEIEDKNILEDTKEVEPVKEEIVEEPEIEYDEPTIEDTEDNSDEVITGSPYDDMLDEMENSDKEPTVDINELLDNKDEEVEEANIVPDAPKDIEENVNLDDTIETDLYGLIDSMYKDDE